MRRQQLTPQVGRAVRSRLAISVTGAVWALALSDRPSSAHVESNAVSMPSRNGDNV